MTRGSIGIAVSLALMVSLALAPTAVFAAERFDGNSRADDHGGSAGAHVSSHQSGLHHAPQQLPHRFFHDRFFHHGSVPFAVIASPGVIYAPPAIYSSPDYSESPASDPPAVMYSGYGAAPAVSDSPGGTLSAAPPPPRVVEYATGRYELRGDGSTTAYRWVWIPNPPPAPPTAPPPGVPASGESSPPIQSHVYRWIDDEGEMHLTDNWDAVPEQYRTQAKRNHPT
jgi:hypothetical protein